VLVELLVRAKRAYKELERTKSDQKLNKVREQVTKINKGVTKELEDLNSGTIL
jgi:hypothetical protein